MRKERCRIGAGLQARLHRDTRKPAYAAMSLTTEPGDSQSQEPTETDWLAMGLWDRFRKNGRAVRDWHERWAAAIGAADASAVVDLDDTLRRQPPIADDLELEEEMLDALRQLVELSRNLDASRLPAIETTHRLVGNDVCHFNAVVSVPDDPAQPTGRLLLTSRRAAFAGGGRVPSLAWHAVREVVRDSRDVLFVGHGDIAVRFRCNSFSDAVCGTAIARYLAEHARSGR